MTEPPPIPSNEANLTPWTKSNFLAVNENDDAARKHAAAIVAQELRDSLLVELVKHYVNADPQRAGELLLMVAAPARRAELVGLLCREAAFVREGINIERLVVACGDSPEALAELIESLPKESDPVLLEELSNCLDSAESYSNLKRRCLQKLLEELD